MRLPTTLSFLLTLAHALPSPDHHHTAAAPSRNISAALFTELSTLSRIVDIAYCVGTLSPGIDAPFNCLSYCHEFPTFELIQTWNTGLTLSDSCGYVALSHRQQHRSGGGVPQIIVAFRGTYSLANALADLSFAPQEYVPYPDNGHDSSIERKCERCTVHAGFLESWAQTEKILSPIVAGLRRKYPGSELVLVGHSLGGAVAALAALDYDARGWNPVVTTFGEPKVGNAALAEYFDARFGRERYRRVTHVNDPVPLLPFESLGYRPHANEIFIRKRELPQEHGDVVYCDGPDDPRCVAGSSLGVWGGSLEGHRDYFHRLGLCLPEGWVRGMEGELK
jgi:hypothetical protein